MRFATLILLTALAAVVTGCAGTPHALVPVDSALRQWEPNVPEDDASAPAAEAPAAEDEETK